ncbi:MAG: ABC transporter permease subunit [Thermoleophilia bacterium]|nr:ABC transporter permease subunit [Thermoleophilia bacterium]
MTWAIDNIDLLATATREHLGLVVVPIALSLVVSVLVAWLVSRTPRLAAVTTVASALLYTIPSLPLFLIIPVVIGTSLRSPTNIVIALTIYGLALLVPTAISSTRGTATPVVEVATALGYSPKQSFWLVQLPLAGPQLLAALRVVSASTISLATLGSVLGVAGLGRLFTDGFQRGLQEEIISGIVLTVALALTCDVLLVLLGRAALPWTRRSAGERA